MVNCEKSLEVCGDIERPTQRYRGGGGGIPRRAAQSRPRSGKADSLSAGPLKVTKNSDILLFTSVT